MKFKGRQLAQWIHEKFPDSACVLAIEFKKFFMDEWTGVADIDQVEEIRKALHATLPGIVETLQHIPQCQQRASQAEATEADSREPSGND